MISGITGCIGVLVASTIVLLIRRDQMQISRAIIWLVIAAGFCLLGFAPKVFDQLAHFSRRLV